MNEDDKLECLCAAVILPMDKLWQKVVDGKLKKPDTVIAVQALRTAVPSLIDEVRRRWTSEAVIDEVEEQE